MSFIIFYLPHFLSREWIFVLVFISLKSISSGLKKRLLLKATSNETIDIKLVSFIENGYSLKCFWKVPRTVLDSTVSRLYTYLLLPLKNQVNHGIPLHLTLLSPHPQVCRQDGRKQPRAAHRPVGPQSPDTLHLSRAADGWWGHSRDRLPRRADMPLGPLRGLGRECLKCQLYFLHAKSYLTKNNTVPE